MSFALICDNCGIIVRKRLINIERLPKGWYQSKSMCPEMHFCEKCSHQIKNRNTVILNRKNTYTRPDFC